MSAKRGQPIVRWLKQGTWTDTTPPDDAAEWLDVIATVRAALHVELAKSTRVDGLGRHIWVLLKAEPGFRVKPTAGVDVEQSAPPDMRDAVRRALKDAGKPVE